MGSGDSESLQSEAETMRSDARVTFHCVYHVVWCTQYRAPVIVGGVQERLQEIIVGVVHEKQAWLRHIETTPTYVYLVVEVGPQFGVHRLVKAVKARSAGQLRDEYPSLRSRIPSMWTNSYLVATSGDGVPSTLVERFVAEQKGR